MIIWKADRIRDGGSISFQVCSPRREYNSIIVDDRKNTETPGRVVWGNIPGKISDEDLTEEEKQVFCQALEEFEERTTLYVHKALDYIAPWVKE